MPVNAMPTIPNPFQSDPQVAPQRTQYQQAKVKSLVPETEEEDRYGRTQKAQRL